MRRALVGLVGALIFWATTALADYRIDVVGNQAYRSHLKPVDKGKTVVFTDSGGTLISIRKTDLRGIHEEKPPVKKPPPDTRKWHLAPNPVGEAPPAQAGASAAAPPSEAAPTPPRWQDVQGMATPSAPDQLQTGRTLAPPSSGTVEVGAPMPMYQAPSPPPPPPPQE